MTLKANPTFLNNKEIKYLKNRKHPITVGITVIPNQILKTKKGYKGYFIDIFKILEKKLGIKFKYVYFKTWSQLLNAAKNKKIDIVFAAQKTPNRLKYFHFTDTILIQQNDILENINNDRYKNIHDLYGKKVAVTKCSAIEEYLKLNYPKIKIIPTKSELQALQLLNEGKVDAAIAENVRAGYYIKKYNLNNIIPGPDLGYNYYLSIASNINEPVLNIILSKAVNNISKEKLKALRLKWGYVKQKIFFINKKLLSYFIIAFLIIIPFSIYLYIINQKLKKEIKEKEQALQRITQLRDSKINQITEILNMISHQWKQPLNSLSLLIQIISKKYKENLLNDEAFSYFEQNAKRQINLMTQTITDFKELFKTDEQKTSFDLTNVINEAVNSCTDTNIKIDIKITGKNFKLCGYPKMLKQILINILNNAKDALKEKQKENPKITIHVKKSNGKTVVNIKDNAGGIPIDIIDKIFEPYFSTKKNKNGTGLGLYMAKIIIEEQMKGKIDVKNTDEGADFKIIFYD